MAPSRIIVKMLKSQMTFGNDAWGIFRSLFQSYLFLQVCFSGALMIQIIADCRKFVR